MDALLAAYNSNSDASDGEKEDDDTSDRAKRQKRMNLSADFAAPCNSSAAPNAERPSTHVLQRSLSQGFQDRYASKRERARERAAMVAAASATPHSPPVHPPPEIENVPNGKLPDHPQKRADYVKEKPGVRVRKTKDWVLQLEGQNKAAGPVGWSPTQLEGHHKGLTSMKWSPMQLEGIYKAGNAGLWSPLHHEDQSKAGATVRCPPAIFEGHNQALSALQWSPTHGGSLIRNELDQDSVLNGKIPDQLPKPMDYHLEKGGGGSHWPQERIFQLEGHNKVMSGVGWSPTQLEGHNKVMSGIGWSPAQLESYNKAIGAVRWSPPQLECHDRAINVARWSSAHMEGQDKFVNPVQRPPLQLESHDSPVSVVRWSPSQLETHNKAMSLVRWSPSQLECHDRAVNEVQWFSRQLKGQDHDERWPLPQLEAGKNVNTQLENHTKALTELESHNKALNKALRELEGHNKALRELEGHNKALSAVPWSHANCLSEMIHQVREHNTVGSSQMSSEGSMLPNYSPQPSQPQQLDSNHGDEEVEEGEQQGQRTERRYDRGQWSLNQLLILCTARREDWKEHGQGASGKVAHQSAEQRWSWISDKCYEHGVVRSAQQCKDKWEQIRSDFTKVYEYEKNLPSSGKVPYFAIEPSERKRKLKLKTVMKLEIFDHLKLWVPNGSRSLETGDVMDNTTTSSEPVAATTPDPVMEIIPGASTAIVSDPGAVVTPDAVMGISPGLSMVMTSDPSTAMTPDPCMEATPGPCSAMASDLGMANFTDSGTGGDGVQYKDTGQDALIDCVSPSTTKLCEDKCGPEVNNASMSVESNKVLPMTAAEENDEEAIEVAKLRILLEAKKHDDTLQLERERIAIAKDFAQGFIGALSAIGNAMVTIASGMTKDKEG